MSKGAYCVPAGKESAYRLQATHENQTLYEIVKKLVKIEQWPNGKLPCDYLVIDIETTGFSKDSDRIVQFGACAVKNCKPVQELWESDYTSVYLQWPEEVFHGKEQAIDIHGIDYKLCSEKGMPPKEAMLLLHDIILWARSEGMMIVGHNLMRFDIPFLVKEFERAGITFEVHSNEIVDTAMLVKAMQLGMMPGNTERACKYWQRVANMYAAGVYYSLDRWCVGRFNLDKKYELSVEDAHDAGTDCFATHCLVLELNAALEDFMD